MKVYIAKRDSIAGELGDVNCQAGDIYCSVKVQDVFGTFFQSKNHLVAYGRVVDNSDLFELWKDDEDHDPSYYLSAFYTQFEMDKIMEHIGQPKFISHLKQKP